MFFLKVSSLEVATSRRVFAESLRLLIYIPPDIGSENTVHPIIFAVVASFNPPKKKKKKKKMFTGLVEEIGSKVLREDRPESGSFIG